MPAPAPTTNKTLSFKGLMELRQSKILEEHSYSVVYMACSPDSTRLAVCRPVDGFEVWIWDVTLGRMETKVSSNFAAQIALIITYSINCWRSFLKFTSNAPAPTLECLEWTSFQKIHLLQPMNFRMGLGHHKKCEKVILDISLLRAALKTAIGSQVGVNHEKCHWNDHFKAQFVILGVGRLCFYL